MYHSVLRRMTLGALALFSLAAFGSSSAQESGSVRLAFSPVEENPVLPVGEAGSFDDVSVRFPHVIYHDEAFHMFYTAYSDPSTPQAIGYAVSADGINWQRPLDGPVFEGSSVAGAFDEFGVNAPVVMVEEDGTWVMLYNGNPEPGLPPFGTSIGRATAPDPTGPWQRDPQPILATGKAGSWDANFVFPSSLLKTDDEYVLYYSANGGGRGRTGRATSPDGITWQKYPDPVLKTGESDEWDFTVAWGAGVERTDHGWEMTYTGGTSVGGPFQGKVGYAYSEDGLNWTKYAANPVVEIEDHSTLFTALEIVEGTYYVYYGLTSTDGAAFTEAHLSTGSVSFDK